MDKESDMPSSDSEQQDDDDKSEQSMVYGMAELLRSRPFRVVMRY